MPGGELAENARRSAIAGALSKFAFFPLNHAGHPRLDRAEAELAIESERAGLDTFFVVAAELVRLNRKY
jgi:hypothetical protein